MNVKNKIFITSVSAALLGGAALWEGVSYKPYKDIGGITTVCYGNTKNIENRIYTNSECKKLLATELMEHGKGVFQCINVPMKQNEYDAFTLMAYNVGVNAFCSSSTVKLFNAGYKQQACNAIAFTPNGNPNWSYVNGKFVQGLFNRRLYERQMCLGEGIEYKT